jgi:hypothetical protein
MIAIAEEGTLKATVSSLIVENLEGEYAFYDEYDQWASKLAEWETAFYAVGNRIASNYHAGRFRTEVAKDPAVSGLRVRLKVSGITPLGALVILGGRLNNGPPESLGKIVVPFEDSLDVLTRIPEDAEGGTYVFFAQQWEIWVDREGKPVGLPAYPGGTLVYVSRMSSVEVYTQTDEKGNWRDTGFPGEREKMSRFSGLAFRGPEQDRRAWVLGTALDVWEIVEAYKAMGIERLLQEGDLPAPKIRLALGYYEAYPDEIDRILAENRRAEEEWHRLYPEVFTPPEQSR